MDQEVGIILTKDLRPQKKKRTNLRNPRLNYGGVALTTGTTIYGLWRAVLRRGKKRRGNSKRGEVKNRGGEGPPPRQLRARMGSISKKGRKRHRFKTERDERGNKEGGRVKLLFGGDRPNRKVCRRKNNFKKTKTNAATH